ncbi:MAG: hypothetical protein V1674_00180 [Candidatus Omnitrophota bacterium]
MNLSTHKGFALFISIFIILAFSTIALLCFNLLTVQDDAAIRNLYSIRAYYLAEAARQLWLEYYAPWGADFTISSQFPSVTKTLAVNQFSINYSPYGQDAGPLTQQRKARVHFQGIILSIPITRTFFLDIDAEPKTALTRTCASDKRDCLSGDLKNFVLNYNGSSDLNLAGTLDYCCCTGFNGSSCCGTYGCPFGDCVGYPPFRGPVVTGDVYSNRNVYFKSGEINGNLYSSSNIQVRECARIINGSVYHGGALNCCRVSGLVPPLVSCKCDNSYTCNNYCCGGGPCLTDGGASGPKPAPSKPAIDTTYFDKQIECAQTYGEVPSGGTKTISSDVNLGTTGDIYVNGKIVINCTGDCTGGSTNISTTGRSCNIVATGDIEVTRSHISERINLISGGRILTNGDPTYGPTVIGGDYSAGPPEQVTGVGCLLYARAQTNPIAIIRDSMVKARILTPASGSVSIISGSNDCAGKIWGIVYTKTTDLSDTRKCPSIVGSIFTDSLSSTMQFGPTEDGTGNSNLFLPLRLRGLYNISTNNWQEQ